jgi:hypothetical protein
MTQSLRDRFKGAKISSLKETRKEAEKKSYKNSGGHAEYHRIEEGINTLRIAPPHSSEDPSYQPFRSAFLKCEPPKLDKEGKPMDGETEIRNKRIFIATVHSTQMGGDPIELYIDYVRKRGQDEFADKDERSKFLSPITGYKDKKGAWHPGIAPSTNYVAYAWKDGKLGRVELYPSMIKTMEKLNISEEVDEAIAVDIFSDPEDGISLIIDYDKSRDKDKYVITKREFDMNKYLKIFKDETLALKKFKEDRQNERLTDKQLEELAEMKPLKELYYDTYTIRDFELALNGLKIFDDENGYGIFENDEFLEKLQLLQDECPSVKDEGSYMEQNPLTKSTPENKKVETPKKEVAKEGPKPAGLNKIQMRKKIMAYILDNYGSEQVMPDLSQEEMVKWCELVDMGEELPFLSFEAKTSPEESAEESKVQEEKPTIKEESISKPVTGLSQSAQDKIAALRAKMAQQNKG